MAALEPKLLAYAMRLAGNSHDASDLVQETFSRCLQSADSLKDSRRLWPWMRTVLRNEYLRRRRRRPHVTISNPQLVSGTQERNSQDQDDDYVEASRL
ncbi:MAG: RNA polymerase sigma factor, partial [Pirellulaceae bacterium]